MSYTVKELRERELERLVAYKTENPSEEDFAKARKLMNSFYRLCGLAERNLYLQNDANTCNTRFAKESEEKESRWYERLKKQFQAEYGLTLYYAGYAPSIGTKDEHGACSEKVTRFFYK